jgi:biopolymer transport protein ExbD
MQLSRQKSTRPVISLVPIIDVMMILLVFFMVTSTYLDLDMLPIVESRDGTIRTGDPSQQETLLIQIRADGQIRVGARALDIYQLTDLVQQTVQDSPSASIVILPSAGASTQDLVMTMDTATKAGATQLRLIRLEARP